jgi:uncharacterized OB-fold protein
MRCVKCGQELTTGDGLGLCNACKNETELKTPKQFGWICPRCGRVYTPWRPKCDYCGEYDL